MPDWFLWTIVFIVACFVIIKLMKAARPKRRRAKDKWRSAKIKRIEKELRALKRL